MGTVGRCKYRIALALCVLVLSVGVATAGSAVAGEAPALLRSFCPTGSGGGQCTIPRGVAVNQASGEIYVADQNNRRIEQFTAWGEFERAWGKDVVASGPDEKGSGFEICVAGSDVCKAGAVGSGRGEFGGTGGGGFTPTSPEGVAVDGEGDVYVVDLTNLRVQKFGPEGEFLLMFGGEVNKTKTEEGKPEAERNICPIDPGDVCREGTKGTGKGQFGVLKVGDAIDTSADGQTIYVGEVGRIQKFDTEGRQIGEVPVPGEAVQSLAVDSSGDLYITHSSAIEIRSDTKPNVFKLGPAGEAICTIEAHEPQALATGPQGEVYVVDAEIPITPVIPREISRYDSSCGGKEVLFGPEDGPGEFTANSTGIAVSAACREAGEEGTDLLVSNPSQGESFVKLFGPPPNANLCQPPLKPPLIDAQFASSVSPEGATVRAQINPRFWPDTAYYVQYGTTACVGEPGAEDWGAGCVKTQPAPPGVALTTATVNADVTTKGVLLGSSEALEPDTAYRYRFVAASDFDVEGNPHNGPVYGAGGGTETEPGVFTSEGQSSGFRTPPLPGPGKTECANEALRSGASANLPDCRAYEMVSPRDKNNGDISSPRIDVLDQAAADGDAISYAAVGSAFGEPAAAPLFNQYMAQREPSGWSSRSISAPRSSVTLYPGFSLFTLFKAFDEELCSGWLLQDTDVPLVEGEVPRGVGNLYRGEDLREGCGGGGYELLSTVFPPGFEPAVEKNESQYFLQMQGFAEEGNTTVFRASGALGPDACHTPNEGKGIFQAYLTREGIPGTPPALISALPSGAADCSGSSVGTAQTFNLLFNTRDDSLHHAISTDASRVYWSASSSPGGLYVRLNPTGPPSALEHGGARGKGDVIGPAEGTGNTKAFGEKNKVTEVKLKAGSQQFVIHQVITDSGGAIPAGTTVTAIEEEPRTKKEEEEGKPKKFKLTLSANATASKTGDELLGHASATVLGVSTEFGEFQAGQRIAGPGIPPGTTIVSCAPGCGPGATSLTLSAVATASKAQALLEASSSCVDPEAACTLPVSEEAEALSGPGVVRYLDAAADGSVAIFAVGKDLYEYDLAKALNGEPATSLIAHETLGILGTNEDASIVYLVSEEELGGEGEPDQPNLYRYERGVGFSFIATLSEGNDVSPGDAQHVSSLIGALPINRVSRVSPDGQSVAFAAESPALAEEVAGYDNTDVASGRADREIYLYDAKANGGEGSLVCASCNPSGARPSGRMTEHPNSEAKNDVWSAARLPGWTTAMHPGNLLSTDGRRLFFESFEPLVPRDTNGRGDVYEWERVADREECLQAIGGELFVAPSATYPYSAGGCLSLISSGRAATDSEVIDASRDGHDVFFLTDANLVAQDSDQFRDVYDAREGGGFPPPPSTPPPCEGDACQNPPPAPQAPKSPSESSGPSGNLAKPGPHCRRGERRMVKKGKARCVPRHRKAARRRARTNRHHEGAHR